MDEQDVQDNHVYLVYLWFKVVRALRFFVVKIVLALSVADRNNLGKLKEVHADH